MPRQRPTEFLRVAGQPGDRPTPCAPRPWMPSVRFGPPPARDCVRPKAQQSRQLVFKCESGQRPVDMVELQDLARAYRTPIAFFLG